LEAEKLLTALSPDERVEASLLIEEADREGFQDFLEKNLPATFPRPTETFILSDEDTSEELEIGTMYCIWDESQLYTKALTHEAKAMHRAIGTTPEFMRWAIWG